jgi:hypothetical protein
MIPDFNPGKAVNWDELNEQKEVSHINFPGMVISSIMN